MRQKAKTFFAQTIQILENDLNEWLKAGKEKEIISRDTMLTHNSRAIIMVIFYTEGK